MTERSELEAIVRDLANATPLGWRLSRYQLPDEGTLECVHCGASNLEAHRPGCLFWRAVQWRDAHPAGGDSHRATTYRREAEDD